MKTGAKENKDFSILFKEVSGLAAAEDKRL